MAVGVVVLAVIGLVPLPLEVNDADIEAAASDAIRSLLNNGLVINDSSGIGQLYDCRFISEDNQLYFRNELGIPDDVFLRHGLRRVPADFEPDFEAGDVILRFSADPDDRSGIGFSYVFGSLAAQGYSISIHQSLLTRYLLYSHRWTS